MNSVSVFDLSPAEKLQLVEDLRDDLASSPESVPLYDWQVKELELRQQNLASHPASAVTWEEIKSRLRKRNVS